MLRRQHATAATLQKYRDAPFDWAAGKTCLHMARFHLRQMGHRPEGLPRIRSAIGARRALDVRGWANVGDMLDTILPRIAPAQMRLGDVAMLDSGDGFGAIVISLGGKVMGWHEGYPGMTALEPIAIAGAWRA
ncbi:hypothetical protein HNO88_000511 [Novosphingobium chloroacetimidivorans]|uniref:DUF6950 domain-containing protein n=1 Tax=Novosphingobium chloroacetimidivorans TaxID=1428314 RepID=A0A7W7K6L3_9SPHN|nr:hypothetical protein [Novosphingobium chloroacetimidivorans]MBB4857204.1 hypothetical protein [Novosphingobium chloroacetimidivorans]